MLLGRCETAFSFEIFKIIPHSPVFLVRHSGDIETLFFSATKNPA